jgi:hypothetical protein
MLRRIHQFFNDEQLQKEPPAISVPLTEGGLKKIEHFDTIFILNVYNPHIKLFTQPG